MRKHVGYTSYRMGSTVLSGVILLVVAAMLIVGVLLVRTKLLQNAQDMGTALARSYAMEEESNLDSLEKNVRLASQYVDEFSQESDDLTVVQHWLSGYFCKLIDTLGSLSVLELLDMAEGKFTVLIPPEKLIEIKTINDIVNIIKENKK